MRTLLGVVLIVLGLGGCAAVVGGGGIESGLVGFALILGGAALARSRSDTTKRAPVTRRSGRRDGPPVRAAQGPFELEKAQPYEKESSSGEQLIGYGYHLRDKNGIGLSHRELQFEQSSAEVVYIAGVTYRAGTAQDPRAHAGARVVLVPTPQNEHDPNAVAVHLEGDGDTHLGYIPASEAPRFQRPLLNGDALEAIILWEWCDKEDDGRRCYFDLLIWRPGVLRPPQGI